MQLHRNILAIIKTFFKVFRCGIYSYINRTDDLKGPLKDTRKWQNAMRSIMRKVVKFGGSSLADAVQFKKAGEIIRSDSSRIFVIPSAPGKRFSGDVKVTDMLLEAYRIAVSGGDLDAQLAAIKARYDEIISGLNLDLTLDDEFSEIRHVLTVDPYQDYAASRGEYLNGRIMAAYLGFDFIDPYEVIFFNDEGNLNNYKPIRCLHRSLISSRMP